MTNKSTKRKDKKDYYKVIELYKQGYRIVDIVKETGLNRSCINNWVRGANGKTFNDDYVNVKLKDDYDPLEYLISLNPNRLHEEIYKDYSYILGLYLGDGCIHSSDRTKCLTITLDKKYNSLNQFSIDSFTRLFNRSPYVYDREPVGRGKAIDIRMTCCNLLILFPQHGPGKKHTRLIKLE